MTRRIAAIAVLYAALSGVAGAPVLAQGADGQARRGAYLFAAGGCLACHTDLKKKGAPLAGGGPINTPFGTFYGPNITPDPAHGIGNWSEADFIRALRDGIRPDGARYFPVFPYTSYTNMADSDMKALWAYLRAQQKVAKPSRPHEVGFPFSWRFLQRFWRLLYFSPGPMTAAAGPPARQRGEYLVRALGHCGECHTPRNFLGGPDTGRDLAGAGDGPEGDLVPNITPDRETGIGGWRDGEVLEYLKSGMDPEGDYAGGLMADVIDHSTSRLSAADRRAILAYLRSIKPIRHRPVAAAKKK